MASASLALLACALCFAYYILLLSYRRHWKALPALEALNGKLPSVSVVVAARNEAGHVGACLDAILGQEGSFEALEVILVDDHSTDDTVNIARAHAGVQVISLSAHSVSAGKKAALTTGIEQAGGDIIVLTDADCHMGTKWLQTLLAYLQPGVSALTGPVCYTSGTGLLGRFQQLELLGLMVVTGGGIGGRMHNLGNGANMAFRKADFVRVGGYSGNRHLASGDDLFLLEKLSSHAGGKVAYACSRKAIVRTTPQRTWGGLIRQRLRWASKNQALRDRSIQLIWSGIWITHAVLLAAILLLPWMSWYAVLATLAALLIKVVADWQLLKTGAELTGDQAALRAFTPAFCVNMAYVLYIGVRSITTRQYTWKGRRTR